MRCPHCKKEIGGQNIANTNLGYFICNLMVYTIPFMVIGTWLNNKTSIPLSVQDGLSWNVYMLPILVVSLLIFIYSLLYSKGKVKGRFLLFK